MVPVELARRLRDVVVSAPEEVAAVYLYGSQARGTASPGSDVDLGLLLQSVPAPALHGPARDMEAAVERAVGMPVEAVVLNTAPADLVHRVSRDGVVILDRDRPARLRFEVQSRNEYFDLAPLRRLYRRRPGVTDPELVAKKLALIETCVRELRSLARPAAMREDVRERRFVEHTLQIAIQAALDVASHIVSDERLGEPDTNRALFDLMAGSGRLPAALASTLRDMAGFRNVIVHGYQDVDLRVVEDVLANHLDDLLAFVAAIRRPSPAG